METLIRICPKCGCSINYKSLSGYNNAIKKESLCRKCASSGENNGMYGKYGEQNPFFGKKHSVETLNNLKKVDKSYTKTDVFREKISVLNKNKIIGTHGKSNYNSWVKKFGIDIANEKMISCKNKHSKNNSGEGNPMYGKPSPTGSGNGWSGWYKGWYFRSLRELTYMINIIERFNLHWISGESNRYKIEYVDYKGCKRNYFPDFIINDKYMIESKPKKLWTSDGVVRKKEAAVKFCEEHGLKYKLVDIGKISNDDIKSLYENSIIKFLPRYEIKFKELLGNK